MDKYTDVVMVSKPVIYISIEEIINTHSVRALGPAPDVGEQMCAVGQAWFNMGDQTHLDLRNAMWAVMEVDSDGSGLTPVVNPEHTGVPRGGGCVCPAWNSLHSPTPSSSHIPNPGLVRSGH